MQKVKEAQHGWTGGMIRWSRARSKQIFWWRRSRWHRPPPPSVSSARAPPPPPPPINAIPPSSTSPPKSSNMSTSFPAPSPPPPSTAPPRTRTKPPFASSPSSSSPSLPHRTPSRRAPPRRPGRRLGQGPDAGSQAPRAAALRADVEDGRVRERRGRGAHQAHPLQSRGRRRSLEFYSCAQPMWMRLVAGVRLRKNRDTQGAVNLDICYDLPQDDTEDICMMTKSSSSHKIELNNKKNAILEEERSREALDQIYEVVVGPGSGNRVNGYIMGVTKYLLRGTTRSSSPVPT